MRGLVSAVAAGAGTPFAACSHQAARDRWFVTLCLLGFQFGIYRGASSP